MMALTDLGQETDMEWIVVLIVAILLLVVWRAKDWKQIFENWEKSDDV